MSTQDSSTFNSSFHSLQNFPITEEEFEHLFREVIRDATDSPGFYYKDLGRDMDSKSFRKVMVELKERLSEHCKRTINKQLNYHWMSRGNHRNSSKFHIDSATDHSILMLGYEPTTVESKVLLADYTKYLEDKGLSAQEYFSNGLNGTYAPNDDELQLYVSELSPFPKEHYRLVVINNSRSFGQKTYGIFHRGEVYENFNQSDRVVDALMISICEVGTEEIHGEHAINNFMNTDHVMS